MVVKYPTGLRTIQNRFKDSYVDLRMLTLDIETTGALQQLQYNDSNTKEHIFDNINKVF